MAKKRHPHSCPKCPHAFSPDGCPFWIEPENGFMEMNPQTGEERLLQGCFMQVIPKVLAHVVRAANRPAAAMESWRNEMANGFAAIAQSMPKQIKSEK